MFETKHHWLLPVIFPDHVSHCDVKMEGCVAVSAGDVNVRTAQASGHSLSLKLKSNPEDSHYLLATLANCSSSLVALNTNRTEALKELAEAADNKGDETKNIGMDNSRSGISAQ